ncbi:Asp23/Gls24 family envelope stress response protein [Spiractinospora alimapuensis]|uniref:Asp23/Gls24 family envelope stress response protein n=1 Tax=Spiractinospora alimapuensis TaxID=2820884 RepID=UPI001F40F5C5|nr:Asp23/Gls24 family envelope stress response protein [Spiractinospora alimapuensis]QVQ50325.1 Asp23/Gls24 family envelope stress response protein [Spiractinospora alimapuensis]
MTETEAKPSDVKVPDAREGRRAGGSSRSDDLVTEAGRTNIASDVVAKVAGMAAREVRGVHEMGGGAARAFGAVRDRVAGGTAAASRGVEVEVGERQAAVDVQLTVDYGVSIPDLASAVRKNVIHSVERMTGLQVTEVNISVDDIHLPEDDSSEDSSAESRVE